MGKELAEKTKRTAALYFEGVEDEKPYALWKAFDPELARDLSLFITGKMYAREKLPHPTRQLVTVAALTTSLAACSTNPVRATACSLPEGPNLEQAISAARFDLETGFTPLFESVDLELVHGKLVARFPGANDDKIAEGESADGRETRRLACLAGHRMFGGGNAVHAECAVREANRFNPKVARQQRTEFERDRVFTRVHERLTGPGPADGQLGPLDPERGKQHDVESPLQPDRKSRALRELTLEGAPANGALEPGISRHDEQSGRERQRQQQPSEADDPPHAASVARGYWCTTKRPSKLM